MATRTPRIPYSLDSHCKFRMSIRAFITIHAKKNTGYPSVVEFGKRAAQRHKSAIMKGSPTMAFTSFDSGGTIYGNNWGLSCPANDHRPSGTHPLPPPSQNLPQTFLVISPELHLSQPWRAYLDETLHFFKGSFSMLPVSYEMTEVEVSFKPNSFMISEDYKRIAQAIAYFESVLEGELYTYSHNPSGGGSVVLPTFIPSLNQYVTANPARAVRTIKDLRYKLNSNKQIDFTKENQLFLDEGRWYCTDFLRRDDRGETVCLKVGWRVPVQMESSGFAAAWLVGFVGAAITCKSVTQLFKFRRTLDDLTEFIECSSRGWTKLKPRHELESAAGSAK